MKKTRPPNRSFTATPDDPTARWRKPKEITIPLGSPSRGYRRHKNLTSMLRDIVKLNRRALDWDDANLLNDYMHSVAKFKRVGSPWTIWMTPCEWAALGRGLRALRECGNKQAGSMYEWLRRERVITYEEVSGEAQN